MKARTRKRFVVGLVVGAALLVILISALPPIMFPIFTALGLFVIDVKSEVTSPEGKLKACAYVVHQMFPPESEAVLNIRPSNRALRHWGGNRVLSTEITADLDLRWIDGNHLLVTVVGIKEADYKVIERITKVGNKFVTFEYLPDTHLQTIKKAFDSPAEDALGIGVTIIERDSGTPAGHVTEVEVVKRTADRTQQYWRQDTVLVLDGSHSIESTVGDKIRLRADCDRSAVISQRDKAFREIPIEYELR